MVDYFSYDRKRKEFGGAPKFSEDVLQILGNEDPDSSKAKQYIKKNPTTMIFDNQPLLSEHSANTERVVTANRSMRHEEGGWPREIDYQEPHDTTKWRQRMQKDEMVKRTLENLYKETERAVKRNNEIDMFEDYFMGETVDHAVEGTSTRTLMLFKDPNEIKRTITQVAWHPEGPGNRMAVAYSVLKFQNIPDRMQLQSYVWDMASPNSPERSILASSPVCKLQFNSKNTETLVGGLYNGVVAFWDLRNRSPLPSQTTPIELSHHEPIYDVSWITSKLGSECVSISTDGRMLWWDNRKLEKPTDSLIITDGIVDPVVGAERVLGGSCLEYNPDAGATKFLAGTEQGYIIQANKKPQRSVEISHRFGFEGGHHHGPIYSIQRNSEETKCFLTVGDWTARIWHEDIKTPIMTTRYHNSYLTDGCWSPTRPGVFFLIESDGWFNVWDYHYRQNEIEFSHKVADTMLTTVTVQNLPSAGRYGSLVAVGDNEGTVTLIELSESLYVPQSNERASIKTMFDRELNREKNLAASRRLLESKKTTKKEESTVNKAEEKLRETIRKLEEKFFKIAELDQEVARVNAAEAEARREEPREPTPPAEDEGEDEKGEEEHGDEEQQHEGDPDEMEAHGDEEEKGDDPHGEMGASAQAPTEMMQGEPHDLAEQPPLEGELKAEEAGDKAE